MTKLILMRHGQSMWNDLNLFTGWVDVPLTTKGIDESLEGGRQLENEPIDIIFTSELIRAQMTAMLAMTKHASNKVPVILHSDKGERENWSQIHNPNIITQTIPVITAWELNERMYGKLQGMDKAEAARAFGVDQIQVWRRSYDIPPPEGESLKMTAERTIPYFEQEIVPLIKKGLNVFIVAHGNSLRSIIMELDGLSEEEVVKLELDTGHPVKYVYNEEKFTKINF